jgi:hypothetical protein
MILRVVTPSAVVIALMLNTPLLISVAVSTDADPVAALLRFVVTVIVVGCGITSLRSLFVHYAMGGGRAVPRRRSTDRVDAPASSGAPEADR